MIHASVNPSASFLVSNYDTNTTPDSVACMGGSVVTLDLRLFGRGLNFHPWHYPVISEIGDRISQVNYLGI